MTQSALAGRSMTVAGFLAFLEDRPNGERWELDDGTPLMNAQPTRRHDWILTNILVALRNARRHAQADWRPSGPSQVPLLGLDRTVAPDVLVAAEDGPDDVSITPHPIVVFEILSRSDTPVRQARKLRDYETVASIRHYVLVRQDRRMVTAYGRGPDGGFVADAGGSAVNLDAIGVVLTLDAIYDETPLAE